MKIVWSTEKRKVKDLIPAEYNPRKLSDKAREDLTNSIGLLNQLLKIKS